MTPSAETLVLSSAELAHDLIHQLRATDPGNITFTQAGLLDGQAWVIDYIQHGEFGLALEHLLYMVHESEIDFPATQVTALHRLATEIGARNHYSTANVRPPDEASVRPDNRGTAE